MSAEIRVFDPAADAENLATFFNTQRYGAIDRGFPMTATALLQLIRDRGVRLLMLAEQSGRIVGTVGYSLVSGRRAAAENELFAGMFLIAPSHRSGFLAGQLFTESFVHLTAMGVRSLRVEVDPANKKAFPLYVRVGFRAIEGMRPDEEGYVELLSVLPGVVADLLEALSERDGVRKAMPKLDWRTLAASRQGLSNGVRRDNTGRTLLVYEFRLGKMRAEVVADALSARTVSVIVDGVKDERFRDLIMETPQLVESSKSLSVGAFTVDIDRSGSITVRHPRHHGPVFVAPFPVGGTTPLGTRRPRVQRVTITTLEDGWVCESESARREVRVVGEAIQLRSVLIGAAPLRESPRSGLRVAEMRQRSRGSSETRGHLVRGIWPLELTDFEGVGDAATVSDLAETEIEWTDRAAGIRLRLSSSEAGKVRVEGPALLLVAAGAELSYSVFAEVTSRIAAAAAHGGGLRPASWSEAKRGGAAVFVGRDASELTSVIVSPDHGLVEWNHRGVQVMDTSFPSTRNFGPLVGVTAALWPSLLTDRSEVDQGSRWALADMRLPFTTSRKDGWSVAPLDDNALAIVVRAPHDEEDTETGVFLVAPGRPASVRIEDSSGAAVELACDGRPWRTWTHRLWIPLPNGFTLGVAPVEGKNPEILVRSTPHGVICTMVTTTPRGGGRSVWRLDHGEATSA